MQWIIKKACSIIALKKAQVSEQTSRKLLYWLRERGMDKWTAI